MAYVMVVDLASEAQTGTVVVRRPVGSGTPLSHAFPYTPRHLSTLPHTPIPFHDFFELPPNYSSSSCQPLSRRPQPDPRARDLQGAQSPDSAPQHCPALPNTYQFATTSPSTRLALFAPKSRVLPILPTSSCQRSPSFRARDLASSRSLSVWRLSVTTPLHQSHPWFSLS